MNRYRNKRWKILSEFWKLKLIEFVCVVLNLQVDLRLKVCRGGSVRKLLVQEAKAFGVSTVILGTSKTHHTIRSSVRVAKYCAKKLHKCVSVFAVDNGKIAFHREASHQGLLHILIFCFFSSSWLVINCVKLLLFSVLVEI